MPLEIKIPALGESVHEAVVGQWRFPDGAAVKKDDVLVELETDKVTQELYSPEDGTLTVKIPAGATVPVDTVIALLTPAFAEGSKTGAGSTAVPPVTGKAANAGGERIEPRVVSPLARKVAQDLGVDVLGLQGTGPAGRITRTDVESAAPSPPGKGLGEGRLEKESRPVNTTTSSPPPPVANWPAPTIPESQRKITREPLPALRKRLAERLVEAQHAAAMLTTFNEADLSAVIALRKKYKDDFEKKHGVSLGFMGFFVSAVCSGLQAVPRLNAQLHTDVSGKSEIVQFHYVDCGVAVSTERGLMVPVIRNAERLSLAQIEWAIKDLATRAREGKIAVEELSGGTFTITNGGVFGSLLSTPILNPPQTGILGMHKIQDRPIALDGQVVIRPMMYLALSYDHRLIDGAEAVRFLIHVKDRIESPERMLLDV